MTGFDAVVLAGGTGRRLGGVSKADVPLAGRRLLDHALDATAGARQVVVVAPDSVPVPDGVRRTLEDPPLGGPVAGIAAGLAALGEQGRGPADLVLVLSCDVPAAAGAVPRLLTAATWGGEHPADGACLRDASGRDQWLVAVYRTVVLQARVVELTDGGALSGVSVRGLVQPLDLVPVPARGGEDADVDTWADLAALEERHR